ncbi:MAG: choice-of-anchor Q domain-containing protein [Anaerolineae bacterium]
MNTLRYALSPLGGALLRAGLIVLTLAAILAAATPIHATTTANIIYVIPGGTGSGTSWADGKDLAPALRDAPSGSQLWVKAGTYKPTTTSDRTATFALKSGVAVYGGFAGNGTETQLSQRNANPATNNTVLSGDIGTPNDNSDNSDHVVTGSGTGSTAILDGFTITGGNANGSDFGGAGGGMVNDGGSPTLINVTFSGNSAKDAGGGMVNGYGSPALTNVTFSGNSATSGGGMYNDLGSPTLTNVTFSGNSARDGGGMYNGYGSPTLTNVTFSGNSATGYGGGMYNAGHSKLTNVTFSGNKATTGGGMDNYGGSPTIRNSILWGDTGGEIVNDYGGSASVTYSIVQGSSAANWWSNNSITNGGGNLDADPLFVTPVTLPPPANTSGNLRLQSGSPAINSGDNGVSNPSLPATDLDGNPRIVGPEVDMGAYEFLCPPGTPATLYVNAAVAGGTGRGDSWANASPTLSFALARALACPTPIVTQVWVAKGTYTPAGPNGDRSATFQLKSGVAVYGGFTSGQSSLSQRNANPATNGTVLSGDLNGDDGPNFANHGENSDHVVTGSGTDRYAVLDGFTISGGNANDSSYTCPAACGGGMVNDGGSPTLTNVTFSGNSAPSGGGGGIYNRGGGSPTLTNVTFSGNFASGLYGDGGGMYNDGGSPMLTNVTFSANSAFFDGGGMFNENGSPTLTNVTFSGNNANGDGGGMFNENGSPTLTNVTFSGNNATNSDGGGMYSSGDNSPTLTNVTFSGNSAIYIGGGMYSSGDNSPTLTNVTFSGNSATYYGGGMYSSGDNSPTLTNVTFSGNSGYYAGGGMYNDSNRLTIRNSILWGDSGGESLGGATISNSIVQGSGGSGAGWNSNFGTDGGGNLDADPKFVTPITARAPTTTGNLRLQSGSPAFNKGNNAVTNPSLPATDLDGNPRIMFGIVDMGAYEIQYTVSFVSPTVGSPSVNSLYPTNIGTTATPIKWTLKNGAGQAITAAGTVTAVSYKVNPGCATTFPTDPTGATAASITSSNPKYDTLQKLWVYNWVLPGRGCYTLFITLNGGQVVPLFYHIY